MNCTIDNALGRNGRRDAQGGAEEGERTVNWQRMEENQLDRRTGERICSILSSLPAFLDLHNSLRIEPKQSKSQNTDRPRENEM